MGGPNRSRTRKRKFQGNRFTTVKVEPETQDVSTASSAKLQNSKTLLRDDFATGEKVIGHRIIDMEILISVFTMLCCPICFKSNLCLIEDSRFGLSSNFCLRCKDCSFAKGFSTSKKKGTCSEVNTRFVYALRIIGKGFTAGKKFCATMNFPFMSKLSFRQQEKKILSATMVCATGSMNTAATEITSFENPENKVTKCGVSVDGTWQRRGYSSLNGVVSAISIITGKILDVEIMSQFCRICKKYKAYSQFEHKCANHSGSAGNMEVVGAYRIFERSESGRMLHYNDYYGDGDSKGYDAVKDIYGKDSVRKLECIGHIQKRVGTHLRKLKLRNKGLGGKGKLTDNFINKLQNYYGIAIRANAGDLLKMQSATIAAFAHCCSSKDKPMHGQCPKGAESWCKYQRAQALHLTTKEPSVGLPQKIVNIVKPVYMKLCDQNLLSKCLHGKTQNTNESFNGVLWTILPKNVFIELETFRLGSFIAVILYNDGFYGLLNVLNELEIDPGHYTLMEYGALDKERIVDAKRHSLPTAKISRKKLRASRKKRYVTDEKKEGVSYKSGEF